MGFLRSSGQYSATLAGHQLHPVTPFPRLPPADLGLVLLAWLGYIVALCASNIILDTARDSLEAHRILTGDQWVLRGPIIGGGIHLGPLWFYLLLPAVPAASATAVAVWVGLLGGSKFLLGWWLGAAVGGRGLARAMVVVLALPAWPGFEMLVFSHTNLIGASSLGFLFGCLQLWRNPSIAWLAWVAGFAILMLHGHPSLAVWLPAALPGLASGFRGRAIGPRHLLVAAIVCASFFVPPLFAPAADSKALGLAHLVPSVSLMLDAPENFLRLVRSIALHGPQSLVGIVADWSSRAAFIVVAASLGMVLVGVATIGANWSRVRGPVLLALGLCVLSLLFCALVRPITPLYMVFAPSTALAAVIAIGLGRWLNGRMGASVTLVLVMAVMGPQVLAVHNLADRGALAIRSPNPSDVGTGFPETDRGTPGEQLSPIASDRIGKLLCNQTAPVHGPLAPRLDLVYGLPTRLSCDMDLDQLQASSPTNAYRWLGLPRAAWEALGRVPDKPLGQWGLTREFEVLAALPLDWSSYRSPADYTPAEWLTAPDAPGIDSWPIRLEPGQAIVVTDRRHFVGLNQRPTLALGEGILEPAWTSAWSTVWQPALRETAELTLTVTGQRRYAIEIVVMPVP